MPGPVRYKPDLRTGKLMLPKSPLPSSPHCNMVNTLLESIALLYKLIYGVLASDTGSSIDKAILTVYFTYQETAADHEFL